jgi:hypothetical protein
MVDFWIMYGSGVPELQQVALRSCQVSGAGAAERGHKNMYESHLGQEEEQNRLR